MRTTINHKRKSNLYYLSSLSFQFLILFPFSPFHFIFSISIYSPINPTFLTTSYTTTPTSQMEASKSWARSRNARNYPPPTSSTPTRSDPPSSNNSAFPPLSPSSPYPPPVPRNQTEPPTTGRIASLRDTFGFITPFHTDPKQPGGRNQQHPDIFFHFSDVLIPPVGELEMNVGSMVEFTHTFQRDGKSKALSVNISPDLQTVFTLPPLPGRILQDRRHRSSLLVEVLTTPTFDSPKETSPTVLPYSYTHPIPLILPHNTSAPPRTPSLPSYRTSRS